MKKLWVFICLLTASPCFGADFSPTFFVGTNGVHSWTNTTSNVTYRLKQAYGTTSNQNFTIGDLTLEKVQGRYSNVLFKVTYTNNRDFSAKFDSEWDFSRGAILHIFNKMTNIMVIHLGFDAL